MAEDIMDGFGFSSTLTTDGPAAAAEEDDDPGRDGAFEITPTELLDDAACSLFPNCGVAAIVS